MIEQIRCDSLSCVHNRDGHCQSGAVDMQFYAGPGYGDVYCNSYAKRDSLRSRAEDALPAGPAMLDATEQNTPRPGGEICCQAEECAFHRASRCQAAQVFVSEPEHHGTLSLCKTYLK